MKTRKGFISNSSSSSFIIKNTSGTFKELTDFVEENPQLIEQFKGKYDWYMNDKNYTQEKLLESAKQNNIWFDPYAEKICMFGDEDGTIIGNVFDYILRYGGKSESFTWEFYESNR